METTPDNPHPDDAVSATALRWQAIEPEVLDWASWGEEHVLFHRPAGKTHLVNAATFQLLTAILPSPRSLPQIQRELALAGFAQDDTETHQLLLRLEELGLIRQDDAA